MKRSYPVAALVALLSLPAAAVTAQSSSTIFKYTHKGSVTTTAVSGKSGQVTKLKASSGILRSVEGREKGDKPVDFVFTFNQETFNPTTEAFNHDDSVAMRFQMDGIFGNNASKKKADIGHQARGVHGINVCMNKAETRVKGVRLFGSHIGSDGKVTRDAALAQEFKRPNCKKWKQRRNCPDGQLAVGLNFHFDPNHGVTGIALRCSAIEVETVQSAKQKLNGPTLQAQPLEAPLPTGSKVKKR